MITHVNTIYTRSAAEVQSSCDTARYDKSMSVSMYRIVFIIRGWMSMYISLWQAGMYVRLDRAQVVSPDKSYSLTSNHWLLSRKMSDLFQSWGFVFSE